MATVVKSSLKSVKVYNPKYIYITPFADGVEGETTYSLEDIIRDSTEITQEDAEETSVDNELKSEPIINNIKAGSYTFTTEVGDMQADLLKELTGFSVDETSGKAYAPSGYIEVFAKIALVFEIGGKYVAAIMPKVQLNSKVTIDSLSSSVGRVTINGTGYSVEITDGMKKYNSPYYMDYDYALPDAE